MTRKPFSITNPDNINEITTCVKHTTTAGNIRYAADGSAHDDLVMTVVNACSSFQKVQFKEMAEEWLEKFASTEMKNYINECMEESEYIESVDYKQVLDVKNRSGLINKSNRYTRGNGYRGDGYGRRGYRN